MNQHLFRETFQSVQAPEQLEQKILERCTMPGKKPQVKRFPFFIAAVLIAALLAFSVTAQAPKECVSEATVISAANREMQTLRQAGLFLPEIQFREGDAHRPAQTNHFLWFSWKTDNSFTLNTKLTNERESYLVHATLDPYTGKITGFTMTALSCAVNPADSAYSQQFEAIIPPDLTLSDYANIWKSYLGYADILLPESADPEQSVVDALRQSESLPIEFSCFLSKKTPAEPIFLSGCASASGPIVCFGTDLPVG